MLKLNDGYWVDSNNNKWECERYTEEQAEVASKKLAKCFDLMNCSKKPRLYIAEPIIEDEIVFYKNDIGVYVIYQDFHDKLFEFEKFISKKFDGTKELYRFLDEVEIVKMAFKLVKFNGWSSCYEASR